MTSTETMTSASATFAIGRIGEFEDSQEDIDAFIERMEHWMTANKIEGSPALETRQKTHIETRAGQSSRFSIYENFFEALVVYRTSLKIGSEKDLRCNLLPTI